jgi:hypothetical protein
MKVVISTHRPPLPPPPPKGNTPDTYLYQKLSRPQGHSAVGSIMSLKNSNNTNRNRTRNLKKNIKILRLDCSDSESILKTKIQGIFDIWLDALEG